MRILLLSPKGGFFGGVEQHVFDIAVGLNEAGHDCHLGFGEWTGRSDDVWQHRFPCHPVRELGAASGSTLDELVERLAPEVVYGHKIEPVIPQLVELNRKLDRWAMIHDHDLVCPRRHKYFAWTGRVCHRPMSAFCLLDGASVQKSADGRLALQSLRPKLRRLRAARRLGGLVVASRFMRDQLVENGCDPRRIKRLAPVPRRPPQILAEGDLGSPSDGTEILFVGQLIRGKGCDLLLRAVSRAATALTVRVVGDGNARSKLQVLARRLGLDEWVRFEGWVDNASLGKFYRRARMVVMPGRWPEPFGLVGLESMAHRRPVVAFDVGGVRDWLDDGKTGLLVGEQDIEALTSAIDRLASDDELVTRLGKEACRSYHRRFRFEPYLRRLVDVLREGAGR
ncbi:MAG: glycosyltransferase family 4 protein [Thermoanaerobaculia bacterium]|nr:glycosyltransferase family 4 protein [Thermoanaerobaculia bacterium]